METIFPQEKRRIIQHVLDNPSQTIRVRGLARELEASPAYVSRSLKLLRRLKTIRDGKVDLSNPFTRALKAFLNVKRLIDSRIVKILQTHIVGAGVYGSWDSRTNTEDSDIDIWIKVGKHPGELKVVSASAEIRSVLKKNV